MPYYPAHLPQTFTTRFWNLLFRNDRYFDFHDGHGPVRARQGRNPDGSRRGWVALTAEVAATAYVSGDAVVCQKARLMGMARAENRVYLCGHCLVEGQAVISKNARVSDHCHISGLVCVGEGSVVQGFALVEGSARVSDSFLGDYVRVGGESDLYKTSLSGNCVFDDRTVARNSRAEGSVQAKGDNRIIGSDLEGAIELENVHLQHVLVRRKARIVNSQFLGLSHVDNIELGGGIEVADINFEGTLRAYDKQSLRLYIEGYSPLKRAYVPGAARI
jgi:acyl-[acyl carrier protein]--UDP-N-acetylglucosamine O-acyltransferase